MALNYMLNLSGEKKTEFQTESSAGGGEESNSRHKGEKSSPSRKKTPSGKEKKHLLDLGGKKEGGHF